MSTTQGAGDVGKSWLLPFEVGPLTDAGPPGIHCGFNG